MSVSPLGMGFQGPFHSTRQPHGWQFCCCSSHPTALPAQDMAKPALLKLGSIEHQFPSFPGIPTGVPLAEGFRDRWF